MVGLEVGQASEHGLGEEVDDEPSALGLLVDDVGEGGDGGGWRQCCLGYREHGFYCSRFVKGAMSEL